MIKPKTPIQKPLALKDLFCSLFIWFLSVLSVLVLIISGVEILLVYWVLLQGHTLNEVQKTMIDYSMPIFAGSGLFLLIYQPIARKLMLSVFRVKKVKKIKQA
ncbi:MAG: hypothetical protein J4215_03150 [Candidatus Diapherotrites archaeon]|uniref:Uncharacterized protein n=1 Tax=Candidatus Iainarchaeum sp. TaxID=3101447 RepID=A0A8T4L2Q6_9ARCH|nr:hypothetical protein [Candidatus Diapherotrites archaeon]